MRSIRVPVLSTFPLLLLACSTTGPQKTVTLDTFRLETVCDAERRLPPGDGWEPISVAEEDATNEVVEVFGQNWSFSKDAEGETKAVWCTEKKKALPPLELRDCCAQGGRGELKIIQLDDAPIAHLDLGAQWVVGWRGQSGYEDGSIWWASSNGKRCGPILGGSVRNLFKTKAGIVAIVRTANLKIVPDKKRAQNIHETSIALIRTGPTVLFPDVLHLEMIRGHAWRVFVQHNESIVLIADTGIWLIHPNGRRVSFICSKLYELGFLRSVLLREDGSALLLTVRGLWEVTGKDKDRVATRVEGVKAWEAFYRMHHVPMWEEPEGDLFFGLPGFMLRYAKDGDQYRAQWYRPRSARK